MLPEELHRQVETLNILFVKSGMKNLSVKCCYFS